MKNIRFSIHIPVYNVEKYLVECVDSVLNQSFKNFEVIIVDDGSLDNSSEICDSFTDPRVRVFHNENRGLLLSRSFSISEANGEYSVFLDSDDYMSVGFLDRINAAIEEENCDIISFAYQRVYSNHTEKPTLPWKDKRVFENKTADEYRNELILNSFLNPICTKVIRTALLRSDKTEYEKFNVISGEDLLRSLYPVFNSRKIVFLPEYWYNYRQNEDSITHTVNPDRYKSMISVRKQTYEYFKKSSFFNDENHIKFSSLVIKLMMDCVISTAGSNYCYERKIQTFNGIMSDEFYNEMLKWLNKLLLPKKRRLIFELFRKKQYIIIILICRLFGKK